MNINELVLACQLFFSIFGITKGQKMKKGILFILLAVAILPLCAQRWGLMYVGYGATKQTASNGFGFQSNATDPVYTGLSKAKISGATTTFGWEVYGEKRYFSLNAGVPLLGGATVSFPEDTRAQVAGTDLSYRFLNVQLGWGGWTNDNFAMYGGVKYHLEAIGKKAGSGTYFETESFSDATLGSGTLLTQNFYNAIAIAGFFKAMVGLYDYHVMLNGGFDLNLINTIGGTKRRYANFGKVRIAPDFSANYLIGKNRNWGIGLGTSYIGRAYSEELPDENEVDEIYIMPEMKWTSFNYEFKLFFMPLGNASVTRTNISVETY